MVKSLKKDAGKRNKISGRKRRIDMDLSSIRGEMKDIDWKAIDAKKKSAESFKQKEYSGGIEAETLIEVLLLLG